METFKKPYTFDIVVRLLIALAVTGVALWLLNRLSAVLLPFLIGWLIAYMLYPIVKFFQYTCRLKYRLLAVFVTLCLTAGIIVGACWLIIPSLIDEFAKMGQLLVQYAHRTDTERLVIYDVIRWLAEQVPAVDYQHLLTLDNLTAILSTVAPQFFNVLSGTWKVLAGLFVAVIILLYVIFILMDYEKIGDGFVAIIPIKYRAFVVTLLHDVESGMNSYFRGQSLIALCVGILFSIGFSIIGLPMAITMGLFIGVLNLVPYLQTVGLIPVLFLTVLRSMETGQNFWLLLLSVGVVVVVVQGLQDLLLTPKIMGKFMGLKPAIILLSLSVFGALFGLVGMIIALPVTTLLISYYKRYVLNTEQVDNETNISNSIKK
ncbi:MAG: AI-2E family transporter [Paludibacteraceae bacterium]